MAKVYHILMYNKAMALFLNQDDNRTELQKRIAAELHEKAKKKAASEGKPVDGVEDSAYLENTKKTSSLALAWIVIIAIAVIILILFAIKAVAP